MAKSKRKNIKEILGGMKISFLVIFVLFVLLLCLYPDNNLFTWMAARREIRRQENLMRKYQLEIVEMDNRIRELSGSRDSLEKFAREEFHFAVPGEDVYLVEE